MKTWLKVLVAVMGSAAAGCEGQIEPFDGAAESQTAPRNEEPKEPKTPQEKPPIDNPEDDKRAEPPPSTQEDTFAAVLTSFGHRMHKLNPKPVPSVAAQGSRLDLWVSETGFAEYSRVRLGDSGSQVTLPKDTVVVRVMRNSAGMIQKYTALVKREPGFNPPSDLWFASYDAEGHVAKDSSGVAIEGPVSSCTSCHLTRANDGYVFGVPDGTE